MVIHEHVILPAPVPPVLLHGACARADIDGRWTMHGPTATPTTAYGSTPPPARLRPRRHRLCPHKRVSTQLWRAMCLAAYGCLLIGVAVITSHGGAMRCVCET